VFWVVVGRRCMVARNPYFEQVRCKWNLVHSPGPFRIIGFGRRGRQRVKTRVKLTLWWPKCVRDKSREARGLSHLPRKIHDPANIVDVAEQKRLNDAREAESVEKMGPYLSERQWGTIREDYSEDGNAWDYFTHDQARSRAYRWAKTGWRGICDEKQRLCFAIAAVERARPDP